MKEKIIAPTLSLPPLSLDEAHDFFIMLRSYGLDHIGKNHSIKQSERIISHMIALLNFIGAHDPQLAQNLFHVRCEWIDLGYFPSAVFSHCTKKAILDTIQLISSIEKPETLAQHDFCLYIRQNKRLTLSERLDCMIVLINNNLLTYCKTKGYNGAYRCFDVTHHFVNWDTRFIGSPSLRFVLLQHLTTKPPEVQLHYLKLCLDKSSPWYELYQADISKDKIQEQKSFIEISYSHYIVNLMTRAEQKLESRMGDIQNHTAGFFSSSSQAYLYTNSTELTPLIEN